MMGLAGMLHTTCGVVCIWLVPMLRLGWFAGFGWRGREHCMIRACLVAFVAAGLAYAMASAVRAQSKDGHDRRVMVINDRTSDMLRLYGARTTTGEWEENIIITPL